jgi:NADH dehydrogenase FAD-containing subunit
VAVKWRTKNDITIDLASVLPKHGVAFSAAGAARVHADSNRVELGDGTFLDYDYLVIATGPELAFDEIEGLGPEKNSYSICDVDHATGANARWEEFCKKSRSNRGRRRARSLVLRPSLRIRDDHGRRSAQASDPRQGSYDLRDG